jgi:hypothetical protein
MGDSVMPSKPAATPQVIGQLAVKLSSLPDEDLELVAEFVSLLEEKRPLEPARRLSATEIREKARRRARLLHDVPREQLVARFIEVGEQIRQEAIAKGTAIDGDWTGD